MRNRSSLVALALVVLCSGILPGCGKPPTDVPSQPELAWQTASTASASSGTTVSASPPFSSTSAATSPVETIRSSAPSKTRTASASPTTAKLPPDPQKVPLGFLGVPVFSMAESRSWYFFVHASTGEVAADVEEKGGDATGTQIHPEKLADGFVFIAGGKVRTALTNQEGIQREGFGRQGGDNGLIRSVQPFFDDSPLRDGIYPVALHGERRVVGLLAQILNL